MRMTVGIVAPHRNHREMRRNCEEKTCGRRCLTPMVRNLENICREICPIFKQSLLHFLFNISCEENICPAKSAIGGRSGVILPCEFRNNRRVIRLFHFFSEEGLSRPENIEREPMPKINVIA